ncbi:MAG: bifunctional riboflavin kinase/FAD synthetase [Gammaproteobacteria bacterium]|nr:bifunctional riboflavin kinase/FAD synthetase [Gammaproteobacteria bacterium]
MQIIRGIYNIRSRHRNCVAAIGNFDGMHLGHQKILKRLKRESIKRHLPAVVITFEPLPQEFLYLMQHLVSDTKSCIARLMTLREKVNKLVQLGIENLLVLPFDARLSSLTPEEFVEKILVNALNCRYLIIGDDFRFGQNRAGDVDFLKSAAQRYKFEVKVIPSLMQHLVSDTKCCIKVSSTTVRKVLQEADFVMAEQLLGHTYQMCGKVIYGEGRGKLLGFPTANMDLKRLISPLKGTFAVQVYGLDKAYQGIANVGYRPTFNSPPNPLLEVHILNFDRDIYGESLNVEFLYKIRDEKKFESQEALKEQISMDVITAKKYFNL